MLEFWIAVAEIDYEGFSKLVMCNSEGAARTKALHMKQMRCGDTYYIRGPFRMDDDVMCGDSTRVDVVGGGERLQQFRKIYTYHLAEATGDDKFEPYEPSSL